MKKKKGRPEAGKGELQNRLHLSTARQVVSEMLPQQRKKRLEELEAEGYEDNEYFDVLVEQDVVLPYDFILFCLLSRTIND